MVKLQNFGENSDMTERKKESFRSFHYKSGTKSFVCFLVRVHSWFSRGVLRGMRDPKKFLNNVGRGILSQNKMHVIKNFPGDLTLDPSISMSPLTLACKCLSSADPYLLLLWKNISSKDDLKNLYTEQQFLFQNVLTKASVD